jgi:hypothetical protein
VIGRRVGLVCALIVASCRGGANVTAPRDAGVVYDSPEVSVHDAAPVTDVLDATTDAGSRCADSIARTVGLQPLARFTAPNGGTTQNAGHLNEIFAVGDLLYAANAEDTVATFTLAADGAVRSLAALPMGVDGRTGRVCTTVAMHPASRTIYCGFTEDASRGLTTFRVGDGGVPTLRDTNAIESLVLNVRDLHIVGDTLYFALFRGGLWAASIGADGALTNFHDTGLVGDIRFVDGDASRLVVLDNDRGLVIARPEGDRVVELGRLGLDGPKIGLTVRGDRAFVALGSAGAYALNVAGERPVVESVFRPPGVVASVDRDGDALAVACTSGVFLYDVSAATPRLAGFANARAIMLYARFHRGELLVADWLDLVRYRVNLRGRPRALDVAWGAYEREEASAKLVVRNVSDDPITFDGHNTFSSRQVAAGMSAEIPLASNLFRADGDELWSLDVEVRTLDDDACVTSVFNARALRRRGALGPRSRPAVGDRMPTFLAASPGGGSFVVPREGEVTRVVFYEADCAAMWPEMLDLEHISARRLDPNGTVPVLISDTNPSRLHVPERWGLRSVRFGYTGSRFDTVPPDVEASAARYGGDVYTNGFIQNEMLSGARHPTDYTVDREGVVRAVERLYRGLWPL